MEGFLYFMGINFVLTFVAAILCVCFAPTAAGPGIPEIKAYLNGVDTPNMFGATTMIVKVEMFGSLVSYTSLTLLRLVNSEEFICNAIRISLDQDRMVKILSYVF
jgi:hypothetical protein